MTGESTELVERLKGSPMHEALAVKDAEITTLQARVKTLEEALEKIADAGRQRMECGRHGGPYQEADFCLTEETRDVALSALQGGDHAG